MRLEIPIDHFLMMADDDGKPEFANNIGVIAENQNEFQDAIGQFTKAISYDKSFSPAYMNRARCYTKLKQYDKSIEDYETLLGLNSDVDLVKALIGNVYCEIASYERALEYQNEAVEINSSRSDNYFLRGITKLRMGKIEGASFDFEYTLKIDPSHQNAVFQIGKIKADKKDFQGAKEAFDHLVSIDPSNGHNVYNRGLVSFTMHNKSDGLQDFLKAHKLGVSLATKSIVDLYVNEYSKKAQFSEAISMLECLIDNAANESTLKMLYYELAECQSEAGDFKNALNSINIHVNLGAELPRSYELRGTINANLGRIEDAIKDYNQVKTIDVSYFDNSAVILLNLPLLDEQMTTDDKIRLTLKAISLVPDYAIAHHNLGVLYKGKNDIENALLSFLNLHRIEANNLDNIKEICECYYVQKEYNQLKSYLEKAVKLGDEGCKNELDALNAHLGL